jgi:hypothetical protein
VALGFAVGVLWVPCVVGWRFTLAFGVSRGLWGRSWRPGCGWTGKGEGLAFLPGEGWGGQWNDGGYGVCTTYLGRCRTLPGCWQRAPLWSCVVQHSSGVFCPGRLGDTRSRFLCKEIGGSAASNGVVRTCLEWGIALRVHSAHLSGVRSAFGVRAGAWWFADGSAVVGPTVAGGLSSALAGELGGDVARVTNLHRHALGSTGVLGG